MRFGKKTCDGVGDEAKTLVVSGLPRSGTSMVARALISASIFFGDGIDAIVYEDNEISRCLDAQDLGALRRAVRDRNTRFQTWGFKKPNIHDFINPKHESFFRNPHYIFTFRDPVAVARRNVISELFDDSMSVSQVISMQSLMARFILRLRYPVLLLSYEKAIQCPSRCIESIVEFAGLRVDEAQRERMVASIEPNRPEYVAQARRTFEGYVDGIQGGVLYGWCRQIGLADPIAVSMFVDERHIGTVLAEDSRDDLIHAGIGSGGHAFQHKLNKWGRDLNGRVRVFAHGRSFELMNSGKTIAELQSCGVDEGSPNCSSQRTVSEIGGGTSK